MGIPERDGDNGQDTSARIKLNLDGNEERDVVKSLHKGRHMPDALTSAERKRIMEMLTVIDLFVERDKDMPVQMIRLFLLIALYEGEGVAELAERAGVPVSVASRHIIDLGEQNRYKDSGHLLVEQRTDLDDRRVRKTGLTPKGRALVQRLLHVLH